MQELVRWTEGRLTGRTGKQATSRAFGVMRTLLLYFSD